MQLELKRITALKSTVDIITAVDTKEYNKLYLRCNDIELSELIVSIRYAYLEGLKEGAKG